MIGEKKRRRREIFFGIITSLNMNRSIELSSNFNMKFLKDRK